MSYKEASVADLVLPADVSGTRRQAGKPPRTRSEKQSKSGDFNFRGRIIQTRCSQTGACNSISLWHFSYLGVGAGLCSPQNILAAAVFARKPHRGREKRNSGTSTCENYEGNSVDIQPACLGLYCGKTLLFKNGSTEIYGECGVCPRGQRTNAQKYCQPCTESPELYDWLYLGFMAMLPLVLHWFFIEWYSGKKSSSALFQHITALFECSMAAIITLLVSDPVGVLYIRSCRVLMLSDWYTMLYNPSPDYVTTVHCTHEAVYPLYTIVFIYYAFCLVFMMLLRPLLVKKIACGLGKSDRFKSIYAALYFFPILTVLQAVGGGLLYYAFPYIILVLSLVTLAVYMSASEIENCYDLLVRKKRLIVLFSHWLLHAYGIISISRVDKLEQDLPLLALVPTPALFYLFTAKFTEPSRILSEGANGH
ncbi:JNK1/MAPK8-associated membrane protein isoform X1 [Canis lupus baileyi]|uniref:JNK1/MAPK8-associated membrane protein isoform X1 n=1 Tax=Canis lupus baileyi TaxID=143281 RepID=UPI003B96B205